MQRTSRRRSACALALLLGFAPRLVLGWCLRAAPSAAPVAVWLADREAHALVALDAELLPLARVHAPWPVRVVARSDGGVWALCARAGDARAAHELRRYDAAGELRERRSVGVVLDAARGVNDSLLLVARSREVSPARGGARVETVELRSFPSAGVARRLHVDERLRRVACSGTSVLAAGADGWALSLRAGEPTRELAFEGSLSQLASAGPAQGYWAWSDGDPGRVLRLDEGGGELWSREIGAEPALFAPAPEAGALWLVEPRRGALFCLTHASRSGYALAAQGSLARVELLGAGQLLLAAPGALLRLGPSRGSTHELVPLPGQGGFTLLVDLSTVPARAP